MIGAAPARERNRNPMGYRPTVMMLRRIAALCLALTVAGCAGDTAGGDGIGTAPGPSSPAVTTSPSAAPSAPVDDLPSVVPPIKPTDGGGLPGEPKPGTRQTVTGEVAAGVEPNCLMLNTPDAQYQLLLRTNGVSRPKIGSRISAVGTVQLNMMTTCQQGVPFVVTEIRPA